MSETDQQVFDADTGEWRPIGAEDTWTVVNENGAEQEVPSSTDVPPITPRCDEIGKRHKYKDRASGEEFDYCLRCGAAKAQPKTESKPRTASVRTSTKQTKTLDMLLGGLWFGAGKLVENMAPEPVGKPVGKVLQLEAGIAGPKLHSLLKRTPLYPYISIASGQLGWAADLGQLLLPPLIVGLAAAQPKAARQLKPMMIMILAPMIAEMAKAASAQAALLDTASNYSSEVMEMTSDIIDDLIGKDEDDG